MEIKSKHLQLGEMQRMSEKIPEGIHWDLGSVTTSDTTAATRWVDGVMTMPAQGKGQVASFIYLDYDEVLMWEKRSDAVVYDETEQS